MLQDSFVAPAHDFRTMRRTRHRYVALAVSIAMLLVFSTCLIMLEQAEHVKALENKIRILEGDRANMAEANRSLSLARSMEAVSLSSSSKGSVCEKHTGGTCFWTQCASYRDATCEHLWSSLQWHSCVCPAGMCAGNDGICHNHTFDISTASWLRKESYSNFFMVLVIFGRSGMDGLIFSFTGLDRITTAHHVIKPTMTLLYKYRLRSWDSLVEEQQLNPIQVVFICSAKLVFWHLAQPVFFWTAWFEYKELMGWWQYVFATLVALKEVWYVCVLGMGVYIAPHFLLFAPFSARLGARVSYLTAPDDFVSRCVAAGFSANNQDFMEAFSALGTTLISFLGALSACVALFFGLVNHGVMYPSLFFGYLLAGISPFGFLLGGYLDNPNDPILQDF